MPIGLTLFLALCAFVTAVLSAMSKCPAWVSAVLVSLALLVSLWR